MEVIRKVRTGLSRDYSLIWILVAVLLLVLSARLAWRIESNTAYFRVNPIFTKGKQHVFFDVFLSVLLYLMHQAALCIWWNAIRIRIIQKGVRLFLLCAYGFMFIFAIYGCMQLLVFNLNPLWFRVSGYFYGVLGVVFPLLGFFASLCLGKPQDFFPPKQFFLVLLPAIFLMFLMMTNEFHMLFFKKSPGESVNLQFVPGILFYIMILWGFVFHILKINMVYQVSKVIKTTKWQRAIPFFTLYCILIYLIPYVRGSMIWNKEPIELAYFIFLVEALFWEFCIRLGYVQANRFHGYIFNNSQIGMEILNTSGDIYLRSDDMRELSREEQNQLIKLGKLENDTGFTYYENSFHGGYLLWRIDNRKMYQAIANLKQNQKELELKLELAQEHYNWEQRERRLRDQKEIFENLNVVVKNQIMALQLAYKEFKYEESNSDFYFRKMLWISVFLKRYVNLFLLYKGGNPIRQEEIELCFLEFGEKLKWFSGIKTTEVCIGYGTVPSEFALLICKLWIALIEWCEYNPSFMETYIEDGHRARFTIESTIVLNKNGFWDWYSHRENMHINNIVVHEGKKQKKLEIYISYVVGGISVLN